MATGTRASPGQLAEDRALVERLLTGDQAAYDQFFEDYFGGLYRFALTRLDFDEELAQEIVQATVATAIERLDAYRGEGALFTWLCGICLNEIRGHFRRLRRAPVEVELVEDTPEIRAVLDALAAGAGGPAVAPLADDALDGGDGLGGHHHQHPAGAGAGGEAVRLEQLVEDGTRLGRRRFLLDAHLGLHHPVGEDQLQAAVGEPHQGLLEGQPDIGAGDLSRARESGREHRSRE